MARHRHRRRFRRGHPFLVAVPAFGEVDGDVAAAVAGHAGGDADQLGADGRAAGPGVKRSRQRAGARVRSAVMAARASQAALEALKAKSAEVRSWRIHRRSTWTLDGLAEAMNPIVRGWINYWGRYHRHQQYPLLNRINVYLVRWARKKYKRLRSLKRVRAWWLAVTSRDPGCSRTGR